MNVTSIRKLTRKGARVHEILRPLLGAIIVIFLLYRLYDVFIVQQEYGPETWLRLAIAGLVIGSVYALIAIVTLSFMAFFL